MSEQTTVPESHRTVGGNLGVSRRGFLRATVATGAAGATVGATSRAPRFSPIGRAEAALPIAVGVAVAGFAGVVLYNEWKGDDGEDADFSDLDDSQAELEIYDKLSSINTTKQSIWRDLGNAWDFKPSDPMHDTLTGLEDTSTDASDSSYVNAAWSDARSELAAAFNDGKSTSEAISQARVALDILTTKVGINLVEDYNSSIKALSSSLYETYERGINGVRPFNSNITRDPFEFYTQETFNANKNNSVDYEPFLQASNGDVLISKVPVDFPADFSELEDVADDAQYHTLGLFVNDNFHVGAVPPELNSATDAVNVSYQSGDVNDTSIQVWADGEIDSALEPKVAANHMLYVEAFNRLDTQYKQLRTDIETYANAVEDQIAAGDLDPEDILTPEEIAEYGADGDDNSRIIAELGAAGVSVPENLGDDVQITVEHDGLDGETTGWLYVNTVGSDDLTVEEGGEIAASQYKSAYLVRYYEDSNGETQTKADYLAPTRQEDTDDDGTMETVNQPISIVEVHSDAEQLTYSQYVDKVSDPASGDDIQAEVEKLSELRREIERLREEEASDPGGAGGGWQSDGKTLGIVALAAAVAALLYSDSGDN